MSLHVIRNAAGQLYSVKDGWGDTADLFTDSTIAGGLPEGGSFEPVGCAWFALCDRQAIDIEVHPVLGGVPICHRCKAKVAALS